MLYFILTVLWPYISFNQLEGSPLVVAQNKKFSGNFVLSANLIKLGSHRDGVEKVEFA